MTDKLSLYNGALRELGERRLKNLSENREPRHILDNVWDNNAVKRCLQKGQWNFATRAMKITATPSVSPDFGFQYAVEKPSDWVRTVGVCVDEYFDQTLRQYRDEAGYWWSDREDIYVRYVSNDPQYGMDFSLWPDNFTHYVECYIALKAIKRLTHAATDKDDLEKDTKAALHEAKTTDAMDDKHPELPPGSWSQSRQGHGSARRDGGNRNSLYG